MFAWFGAQLLAFLVGVVVSQSNVFFPDMGVLLTIEKYPLFSFNQQYTENSRLPKEIMIYSQKYLSRGERMIIAALLGTQPSDIWHDPIFQFSVTIIIAVLAVIISIFVPLWIYRRQRSIKELTYQVISDASVISIDQDIANRVKIELDGSQVTEVTLAIIKVWNSGNTAIKKDDYDVPLGFEFERREVISHDPIDTEPKDLITDDVKKTLLTLSAPNTTSLTPMLLNAKESISFSVLLKGPIGKISKRGRIIDGNIVEMDLKNQPVRVSMLTVLLYILFFVSMVVWTLILIYVPNNISTTISIVVILLTLVLVLLLLIYNAGHHAKNIVRNGLKITWRN